MLKCNVRTDLVRYEIELNYLNDREQIELFMYYMYLCMNLLDKCWD